MKRSLYLFALLLIISKVAYCQMDRGGDMYWDDEDDEWTLERVGFDLAAGTVLAVIGYLIMQIKAVKTLGQILIGIGAFLGIGAVLLYLLQIIGMILSAVFSFALKAALVVGAIVVVFWILKSIYGWISGNK
jgi:hypothetical protein